MSDSLDCMVCIMAVFEMPCVKFSAFGYCFYDKLKRRD